MSMILRTTLSGGITLGQATYLLRGAQAGGRISARSAPNVEQGDGLWTRNQGFAIRADTLAQMQSMTEGNRKCLDFLPRARTNRALGARFALMSDAQAEVFAVQAHAVAQMRFGLRTGGPQQAQLARGWKRAKRVTGCSKTPKQQARRKTMCRSAMRPCWIWCFQRAADPFFRGLFSAEPLNRSALGLGFRPFVGGMQIHARLVHRALRVVVGLHRWRYSFNLSRVPVGR